MAAYTKSNPSKIALGTLYSTLQLKAFKVDPSAAFASADLAGTATRVMEELGTTAAMFQVKANGDYAIVIGDGHALNVDILAKRIGLVHGGDQTGSLTASGVWTSADASTVTVTELTTLLAL